LNGPVPRCWERAGHALELVDDAEDVVPGDEVQRVEHGDGL